MTEKFNLAGIKSRISKNSSDRDRIRAQFKKKEFNYLFVVDIFNEGVDIPEIDTVLF
jgi:superfamily II DNA or RNA helicase